MNHPYGVMSAYIQNVSYCKRSIIFMKTYQKECKCCIRFLLTHFNKRAYKRLLWLSNVSNKSKRLVALSKPAFYIYERWFSKQSLIRQ